MSVYYITYILFLVVCASGIILLYGWHQSNWHQSNWHQNDWQQRVNWHQEFEPNGVVGMIFLLSTLALLVFGVLIVLESSVGPIG